MSHLDQNVNISHANINTVEFYLLGSDENRIDSCSKILNSKILKDNVPVADGIYNINLGTTDNKFKCHTCYNYKTYCPGHSGHIVSPYPLISPFGKKELMKWLKILCFNCGNTIMENNQSFKDHLKKVKNLKELSCFYCKHINNKIYLNPKNNMFIMSYNKENDLEDRVDNIVIESVLNKVTNETVQILKKTYHPKVLINRILRVPAVTLRPDVKKYNGSRSNNNDTTTFLKSIMMILEKLPFFIGNEEIATLDKKTREALDAIEIEYFTMIKSQSASNTPQLVSTNNAKLVPLSARHTGKPGRVRGNLMSKRVFYMARSVISGDPYIKLTEVGIPIAIARNIQIPITVNSFNMSEMLIYFNNKTKTYPGCTKIIKKSDGQEYDVTINKRLSLEIGDIIYRDIIDGDYVAMNRQPSLLFSSISGHIVKVMEKGNTIRLSVNVAATLYNGDFDGDQMNAIIPHSIISRNECNTLTSLKRWFISYKNGNPSIGIYHDGLINTFLFTKHDHTINKFNCMQMFCKSKNLNWKMIKDINKSRNMISMLLPKINYKKKTNYYNSDYEGMLKYKDDQKNIIIKNGKILTGCLDKKSVGQGTNDSIFHIIYNEYGPDVALDLIYNIQQICSYFINHRGFTINYEDILIPQDAYKLVEERTKKIINESNIITQKVKENQYITPINTTLEEYYERLQIAALNLGDEFLEPVFSNIDSENNLYNLIASGCKGKMNNLLQISSAVGQTSIAGQRMFTNFSHGRTLPYFERFNTSPISRGFVAESYATGVNNISFIFQAMEGRISIINKALSTADTGYQNRKSIKNLESNVIDNLRKTCKKYKIVQTLYGGDGVDPRFLEFVKFEKFLASNLEFEKTYKANIKDFDSKYNNNTVKKLIDNEYEFLVKQRDEYRNIFMNIEMKNSKTELLTDSVKLPVNINRIIENVCNENEAYISKLKLIDINPINSIKLVNKLILKIKYCYYNDIQYKLKTEIPEYINKALTLFTISIRTNLYLKNIINRRLDNNLLKNIIFRIINQFNKSLIDPGTSIGIITAQCISENLTQYVLDSHHRAGVAGSEIDFISRYKEITGVRDTSQMSVPIMHLHLKNEYTHDVYKIKKIMNKIEMINLKMFITICDIFYESYGNIKHPDYKHEEIMIKEFEKHNKKIIKPSNLSNFCIRLELNREKLIEKSISLEKICFKLHVQYNFLFIVYNFENADNIILRLYIANSFFKKKEFDEQLAEIDKFINKKLFNTLIRGVNNINSTSLSNKLLRSVINEDGSISKQSKNVISTVGTNLEDMLDNKYIDPYISYSNSLVEVQDILGIGAAKNLTMYELANLVPGVDFRHYLMYTSEMTMTGTLTSMERTGSLIREPNNTLLHISTSHILQVLESAAINNVKTDATQSFSSNLMISKVAPVGSRYNKIILNEGFVLENKK